MTITKQSSRRKELVSAAAHLFKENSFDRTTVRMLATKTGLKSGSLFHHFKDKEEILVAVIESGLTKSLESIKKVVGKKLSPEEQLFEAIYSHLKTLHGQDKDAHVVSVTEWQSLSEQSRNHLISIRDEYEHYWQVVIQNATSAGILSGEPHLLRLFTLGSLNWTIQWFQSGQKLSVQQLAEQFFQFVTHKTFKPEK